METKIPQNGDADEVLEGEIVQPERGTLAWLRAQEHVEVVEGRRLPVMHRLDLNAGKLLQTSPDDTRCQYERPDGRRCGAPRLLDYGICLIHSGGGSDLQEMGKKGAATKTRLRIARQTLGIGSSRTADPRSLSRIRAQARAEEIAAQLLAPLDDKALSATAQQRSAVTILDALWPQQTVSLTVEVPSDEAGVQGLSWQEMEALAAQLLGDTTGTPELEPA